MALVHVLVQALEIETETNIVHNEDMIKSALVLLSLIKRALRRSFDSKRIEAISKVSSG